MFRLEKVLRWKETLEKEARIRRLEMERRMSELEAMASSARAQRGAAPDETAAYDELLEWSRYLERMRRTEMRILERVEELRPALAERMRIHQEIRREVKGLEKLEARQRDRLAERREKDSQAASDEAAARTRLPGVGKNIPHGLGVAKRAISSRGLREGIEGVSTTQEGASP